MERGLGTGYQVKLIDCGVKAVFHDYDDSCTYILNMSDTAIRVGGKQDYALTALLPSTSNPKSVNDAVFVHFIHFVKDEKEIETSHLITFSENSIVRVYRDIFLVCDKNTKSWFLVRIIVS